MVGQMISTSPFVVMVLMALLPVVVVKVAVGTDGVGVVTISTVPFALLLGVAIVVV